MAQRVTRRNSNRDVKFIPVSDIPQDLSGPNRLPLLPGEPDPDAVFAQCLRAAREASGLTQQQLADQMTRAGYRMRQGTVSKIEAGDRPVWLGEAVNLARIVGVDLTDLTEPGNGERGELPVALAEVAGHQRNVEALEDVARRAQADADDAQVALDLARTHLDAARLRVEMIKRRTNPGEVTR